jgi:chromosome segregation ATPase
MIDLAEIIQGWHEMTPEEKQRIELDRLQGEYKRLVEKWNKDTTQLQNQLSQLQMRLDMKNKVVKELQAQRDRAMEGYKEIYRAYCHNLEGVTPLIRVKPWQDREKYIMEPK